MSKHPQLLNTQGIKNWKGFLSVFRGVQFWSKLLLRFYKSFFKRERDKAVLNNFILLLTYCFLRHKSVPLTGFISYHTKLFFSFNKHCNWKYFIKDVYHTWPKYTIKVSYKSVGIHRCKNYKQHIKTHISYLLIKLKLV